MHVGTIGPFEFHLPMSGGKAGHGRNRTSTIQVRRNGCVVKQFRFNVSDGTHAVVLKAKAWVLAQLTEPARDLP